MKKPQRVPPPKQEDDTASAEAVTNQIVTHRHSPYTILLNFELNNCSLEEQISEKTLYRYIYEEFIEGVCLKNIL